MTSRGSTATLGSAASTVLALCLGLLPVPAAAVTVELKSTAPDRVERQRAAAEGRLPLPGTPDIGHLEERFSAKGLSLGSQVYIRIFKAQSELEVWVEKDGSFVQFATYPICHWSGGLGPKLRQGDKQSPEGFYSLTTRNLHLAGRWPRALNLGYPNAFDRSQARSGSYILLHGGCSSVGCFAMTNPVMSEIFSLTTAALNGGQRHIPVHVYPFRMTGEEMERNRSSEWNSFWINLKEGHDIFERTRRPPRVSVCQNRYFFQERFPLDTGDPGPIAVCGETAALLEGVDRLEALMPADGLRQVWASAGAGSGIFAGLTAASLRALLADGSPLMAENAVSEAPRGRIAMARGPSCSPTLPSCRRHLALQLRSASKLARGGGRLANRPNRTDTRSRAGRG